MTLIPRLETPGCGCDAPEQVARLISIDEALGLISRHAAPVSGSETVPLLRAKGRVLTKPVHALGLTPPFDNSAMDGYAVKLASFDGSGPWTLSVSDRVPAGEAPRTAVTAATAARIFTGAPIPPGSDAVIRQEDAVRTGQEVTFNQRPACGQDIRRAGADMKPGQKILDAGACLGPREIAACAAAGVGAVTVQRALRVALLVTGDEVRAAGAQCDEANIWDVNTPMLCAALDTPQIELVHAGLVADNQIAVQHRLAELAGQADLIVTTGGVSVGEEDHAKPAFDALGGEIRFSGVAIKPGKPITYGGLGTCHWLGLPGNPLSAFVTWQIFGTALVRQLTGQSAPRAVRRHVVTGADIRRNPGRCELRLASLIGFDGNGREIVGFENATHSGRVGRMPLSDGLIFLPAETDHLPAGALVEFLPFCDS